MSTEQREPMSDTEAVEIIRKFKDEYYDSTGGYRYNKHEVCAHIQMYVGTPRFGHPMPRTFEEAQEDAGYHYVPITEEDFNLWWEAQLVHADILVRCGKQYLDENYPDWRDMVSATRLDMSSGTSCIIGQVFGEYNDGIRQIYMRELEEHGEGIDEIVGNGRWAKEHGFIDNGATYQALDEVWQRALAGEL